VVRLGNKGKEKLLGLNKEKYSTINELAIGIAHEIKNPLCSLKGFVQLMARKKDFCSNRYYLDLMEQDINRIDEIVSEFLQLSKPWGEDICIQNINNILRETCYTMESYSSSRNIKISLSSHFSAFIKADKTRIKTALTNIIKNSIEASEYGANIDIYTIINNNNVDIIIKDYGIGIPVQIIDKIGQPFFTTKESGTGLGLMVSKSIIEGHRGTVIIKSEYGKGTEITISLPLYQDAVD
jgi:signal transduction histidine kinase